MSSPLDKPLKFGDKDQINKINSIQEEIREQEEETGPLSDGLLKKYCVIVMIETHDLKEVYAHNKKEACEIVKRMSFDFSDFEITDIYATEDKP